jgi:antirestriction protein
MQNNATADFGIFVTPRNPEGIPIEGAWVDLSEFGDWDSFADHCTATFGSNPSADELVVENATGIAGALFSGGYVLDPVDHETVMDIVSFIHESDTDPHAIESYLQYHGGEWDRDNFEDTYIGYYDSENAYVEYVLEAGLLGRIDAKIVPYLDYAAIYADFTHDVTEVNGHYFQL